MTKEEYQDRRNQLELEYYKKKKDLANEYAKSNVPHKVGDVVEDHFGKIKIERIKFIWTANDELDYLYYGLELKKDGTPRKKQTGRSVYQSNIDNMINEDFNSVFELFEAFPDEQSCIDHLERLRWEGNVVSPFDSSSIVYKCKDNKYRCKNTGKYFNVKTNTLFDSTKVSLRKWFAAIWLVTCHKRGISSIQLGRDIGVTQKTAWFMLHRIRKAFKLNNDDKLMAKPIPP